jgi:hypothetical protein
MTGRARSGEGAWPWPEPGSAREAVTRHQGPTVTSVVGPRAAGRTGGEKAVRTVGTVVKDPPDGLPDD